MGILKGIAIAASAGVALGVASLRKKPTAQEEILNLEPLFDRLDRQDEEIATLRTAMQEMRLVKAEPAPPALPAPVPDGKMEKRMSAVERSLLECSIGVSGLKQRVEETDANMQRLIAAIEKLCARQFSTPEGPGPVVATSFQMALDRALEQPLVREERKPRTPMGGIY